MDTRVTAVEFERCFCLKRKKMEHPRCKVGLWIIMEVGDLSSGRTEVCYKTMDEDMREVQYFTKRGICCFK